MRGYRKPVELTEKERRFLLDALNYELNLVVQLPDRKVMRPSLERFADRLKDGLNGLNLQADKIGKVAAGGELLVDIDEYRLYELYNVNQWTRSQATIYRQLRSKLKTSYCRQPIKFQMEA